MSKKKKKAKSTTTTPEFATKVQLLAAAIIGLWSMPFLFILKEVFDLPAGFYGTVPVLVFIVIDILNRFVFAKHTGYYRLYNRGSFSARPSKYKKPSIKEEKSTIIFYILLSIFGFIVTQITTSDTDKHPEQYIKIIENTTIEHKDLDIFTSNVELVEDDYEVILIIDHKANPDLSTALSVKEEDVFAVGEYSITVGDIYSNNISLKIEP